MGHSSGTQVATEVDTGGHPFPGEDNRQGEAIVLFTTHAGTVAALKMAARLGVNLGARPRVLMLYEVPYTLPLEKRALPDVYVENQVRALQLDFPGEISVQVHLCRHLREGLREVLPPHSLIVMGGRKRWWPTPEQRLAKFLHSSGHQVIFAEEKAPGAELTAPTTAADQDR
jgi:hypothetical protein